MDDTMLNLLRKATKIPRINKQITGKAIETKYILGE